MTVLTEYHALEIMALALAGYGVGLLLDWWLNGPPNDLGGRS